MSNWNRFLKTPAKEKDAFYSDHEALFSSYCKALQEHARPKEINGLNNEILAGSQLKRENLPDEEY